MDEPALLLAHSLRPWSRRLHFFLMDHGGAVLRGHVGSIDEVLARDANAIVVDDTTSFLTPLGISRVRERGTAIVGVYDADDGESGRAHLLELGVDAVVPCDLAPELLLAEVIRVLVAKGREPVGEAQATAGPPGVDAPLIAIGSAGGGGGATEIAVAAAAALRHDGRDVAVVDADDQSPGLALRLRVPEHPNLRSAIEAVVHGSRPVAACLASSGEGMAVLPGVVHPGEWRNLRPEEVLDVLRELSSSGRTVLANVGPRIEQLPGIGHLARFGVARSIIAESDAVVVVAGAGPGGVRRLLEWAIAAGPLLARRAPHVVLNRHVGNRRTAAELAAEVAAALPSCPVHVVPFDRKVVAAEWDGCLVASGPFTAAVSELAASLVR